MVEICSHSPTCLHGAVLDCLTRQRDIFTIMSHVLLEHFHYVHSLDIILTHASAADHTFTCADGLATVQVALDALLNCMARNLMTFRKICSVSYLLRAFRRIHVCIRGGPIGPCTATYSGLLCFPFYSSPQQFCASNETQDLVRGGVEIVTWFHKVLTQVTNLQ
jgi:hypothetical protein